MWIKRGFSGGWEVPRVGLSGGLILAWTPKQNLKVIHSSEHLIHTNCLDNKGCPLSITFVYGHPEHSKREAVWHKLKSLKCGAHSNWLCIGDFNQVLKQDEKFAFHQGNLVGAPLFQQVIDELQLCDLAASRQRFTWMNNRDDEDFVMERLDRAFASIDWVNSYPLYSLRNLLIIRSDHGPFILDLEVQGPSRKRPFRFEQMWLTHPGCREMIQQAWDVQSHGSRAVRLRNKILNVRRIALKWNREVFGKVENCIKMKQIALQHIQNSIKSMDDFQKEKNLREEIEVLLDREELMWVQKARTKWILQGDRNTRFFQTVVKQRRARSRILQIKNDQGLLADIPEEIENILTSHFRKSYENYNNTNVNDIIHELENLPIPVLSEQQCSMLNRPIFDIEIKEAFFQLGPHKAPGPDGIPAFFFQEFWNMVKFDVINTVQAFFHSSSLFKPLNYTFINLIPKIAYPNEVTHFRPISLCNVVYKVMSELLVNRLKPIMDSLITPYQNASIQGKNISDDILLAHEILNVLRKKKGRKFSFGALKIDMSKAYDRVNSNFLKAVLSVMKFDSKWINWIMKCVSSVSYTLLVNGNLTTLFILAQGLRQGDPLSLIFFFCVQTSFPFPFFKQKVLIG